MMSTMEPSSSKTIKALPEPKEVARRYLICTGCSKGTEPPIYICRDGHPLCKTCSDTDLRYCPYVESPRHKACQEEFIRFPMGIYKYLHANSTFTCPNMPNGCPILMKGKFIKNHLAQCEYRNLPNCVFTDCDLYDCILTEYHFHLNMDHNADTIVNNKAQLQLLFDSSYREKYPRRSPYMFFFYQARFVLVIHEYEERVAMWISLVHGPSTQKYRAIFRMPYNKPQGDADENKGDGIQLEEVAGNEATANDEKEEDAGNKATSNDEKVTEEDAGNKATSNDEKVTEEDAGNKTASNDEKVTEEDESSANGDEDADTEEKGNEKVVSHEVHPMSMPIEDIIDLCECVDMPGWVVESSHIITDKNKRLIWPIEIHIECEEFNYDDADITIGYDDVDDDDDGNGNNNAEENK